MSKLRIITNFIEPFFKASEIKKDPEKAKKCVRLGVMSIIFSLVAVVIAFGGALLLKFSMDFTSTQSVILGIFLLIISIAFLFGSLLFVGYGLVYMIAQLTVNRKAIGWIALVVLIASTAGAAVIILVTLGGI